MRGAGCTINDMWDKDFDKNVARTQNRPLASGKLTMDQAFKFLALQLSCGLGVLLTFNNYSILLGAASLPLVVIYPLMKRYTNWPQFILGLTFNWGALMGWAAVHGDLSLPHVLPLYASGVFWTLVYDTLYGYQDRADDSKLGLKSTALYLGENPQWPLTALASAMTVGLLTTGSVAGLTLPYYGGVALVGTHMLWQIWSADINNPSNLAKRFNSNSSVGLLLALSITAGHF
jgi:4-hydroxybenzoate polyprenyltransferase